jgi:hypothetical protein
MLLKTETDRVLARHKILLHQSEEIQCGLVHSADDPAHSWLRARVAAARAFTR